MPVVLDLIKQAYAEINQMEPDGTPAAGEQTTALARLNQILGQLGTEGKVAYSQVVVSGNLSTGQGAYTVGAGGTLGPGYRVQKITAWRAYFDGLFTDGGPVLSLEQFGAAVDADPGKAGVQMPIPRYVGADTAYPILNVRVWPPPGSTPGTLELFGWKPLDKFGSVNDQVNLADGWERMLHLLLAVDLLAVYPRDDVNAQILAANAQSAKAAIVDQNTMGPAAPQKQ